MDIFGDIYVLGSSEYNCVGTMFVCRLLCVQGAKPKSLYLKNLGAAVIRKQTDCKIFSKNNL